MHRRVWHRCWYSLVCSHTPDALMEVGGYCRCPYLSLARRDHTINMCQCCFCILCMFAQDLRLAGEGILSYCFRHEPFQLMSMLTAVLRVKDVFAIFEKALILYKR